MSIKKVSVTSTSTFVIDGEGVVTRERIVGMSHNWTERDIALFKKIAKQGGSCKIQGVKYMVSIGDKITNSQFERVSATIPKMHGPEE